MNPMVNQLAGKRQILALLLFIVYIGMSVEVSARCTKLNTNLSEKPDGTQAAPDRPINALYSPKEPVVCETFWADVDEAIIRWQEVKGTYLIVIARLGEGEGRSLK